MGKNSKSTRKKATSVSLTTSGPKRGAVTVRIVGGDLKRSLLTVPAGEGVRPTPERVRETVFDWLNHLWGGFEDRHVWDMFAGTGAMGFEAASRGVASVLWTDKVRANTQAIHQSVVRLKPESDVSVKTTDAFAEATKHPNEFDLIVIDPPFAQDWQAKAVEAALTALKPEGLLYVESPQSPLTDEFCVRFGLIRMRQAKAGQVLSELFAREGSIISDKAKKPKGK